MTTDEMEEIKFNNKLAAILIDFKMEIEEREKQNTELVLQDQSDIYGKAKSRLKRLFSIRNKKVVDTALEKQRKEMLIRGELSTIEWIIGVIKVGRDILKHTDRNTMDIMLLKLEMLQKKDKEFLANLTPQKDEEGNKRL